MTDLTPSAGLDVGDGRNLVATFTTSAGSAATVALEDVDLTIRKPDGTRVLPATTAAGLELSATGVVKYPLVFDLAGEWRWEFEWDNGAHLPQVAAGSVTVRRKAARA